MKIPSWSLWSLFVVPVFSSYYFNNPPPVGDSSNPSYTIGDNINVQWTATDGETDHLDLSMWQVGTGKEYPVFWNVSGLSSYQWTIETDANLTETNEFFFALYISGAPDVISNSHNFNLTAPAQTSTTTSASSTPTPTPTHPIGHTIPSATSSGSAGSDSSSDSGSSGLSTGAKAGIGVAIPVAVIAGVVAGVLFARRMRKRPNAEDTTAAAMPMGQAQDRPKSTSTYQPSSTAYAPSYMHVPTEMPDTSSRWSTQAPPAEMPGEGTK